MENSRKIVIWGSSGHAKVIASIISAAGDQVVALFDNNPASQSVIDGVGLHIGKESFVEWVAQQNGDTKLFGVAAIGGANGQDRIEIHDLFEENGLSPISIVHPQASVCSSARLGEANQVFAQANVAAESVLGRSCIINHMSSVDHDCTVGQGVHLAPNSTLCGCVTLEDFVMVGAGATVLPRVKIGAATIIGAGTVVTRDIPANVIAYGNPARVIRN